MLSENCSITQDSNHSRAHFIQCFTWKVIMGNIRKFFLEWGVEDKLRIKEDFKIFYSSRFVNIRISNVQFLHAIILILWTYTYFKTSNFLLENFLQWKTQNEVRNLQNRKIFEVDGTSEIIWILKVLFFILFIRGSRYW